MIIWIIGAHVAVIAGLVAAQYRRLAPGDSADGVRYFRMVRGEAVPPPYCYRPFVPFVARLVSRLSSLDELDALFIVSTVGSAVAVGACYAFTLVLTGSMWLALIACIVVVTTYALFGTWIKMAVLVDSWGLAFALGAAIAAPFSGIAAAALLVLAALSKESAFAVGAGYVIASDPSLWWIALPGLAAYAALYLLVQRGERTVGWENPLTALREKKAEWLSYQNNLSGLGATPWLAAYYLPQSEFVIPAAVVVLIAWSQTLIGCDHQRLIAFAVPFVVPMLCAVTPPAILGPYILAQLFWPFKTTQQSYI